MWRFLWNLALVDASSASLTLLFFTLVVASISGLSLKSSSTIIDRNSSLLEEITPTSSSSVIETPNKKTKATSKKAVLPKLTIFYGTQTGHCRRLAKALVHRWERAGGNAKSQDLENYEPEYLLEKEVTEKRACVFLVSTCVGGTPPPSAVNFFEWLRDVTHDFRRSKASLSGLAGVAVFGLGSSEYDPETFCKPVTELTDLLESFGATSLFDTEGELPEPGMGDDAVGNRMDESFAAWAEKLVKESTTFEDVEEPSPESATPSLKTAPIYGRVPYSQRGGSDNKSKKQENKVPYSRKNRLAGKWRKRRRKKQKQNETKLDKDGLPEASLEDKINDLYVDVESGGSNLLDIEELAAALLKNSGDDTKKEDVKTKDESKTSEEMITARQRVSLTKEGYKIIGSHSAVKLCRWTKNQLRGRGGCYKHTCYGITSYQCMEATPSLACANKCTFCWRHHKNPVGTRWRWKEDDPIHIVKRAIELHCQMVKQMKGVPGVKEERLREAATVRHCALSLVGEPIMYPRINELVGELHRRDISTFLVTNAQFPECIEKLAPVTQLYVSVDAATPEAMKAVDRPLFKDFWERFTRSLRALRDKKQRTVYRLTLLKGHNMDDIKNYGDLVALGEPDFIEIKAVTYCGTSEASDLKMENVPFHDEVLAFSQQICDYVNAKARKQEEQAKNQREEVGEVELPKDISFATYAVASEHQHSNLVLLAKESYRIHYDDEEEHKDSKQSHDSIEVLDDSFNNENEEGKVATRTFEHFQSNKNTSELKRKRPRWRTWIDYPKFHQLWREWEAKNAGLMSTEKKAEGEENSLISNKHNTLIHTFSAEDYAAETPHWAVFGAPERGMDPLETRWYHNRTVRRAREGKLSALQMKQYPTNPALQEMPEDKPNFNASISK